MTQPRHKSNLWMLALVALPEEGVYGNYWERLMRRSVTIRAKGTFVQETLTDDASKNNIPTPEAGKFQAARLNKFDGSLVIENMEPLKTVQSSEVVIDVHYCTINPCDVLLSQNMYTYEPKLPIVLGHELVGELVHVGKDAQDKGYKIGDKVIALNKERYGGFAELCVAEVCDIWKIPSNINCLDATCLLNDYMTALIALERVVTIDEDDTILVNIGFSSPGLAAADLATNIFRSQVIAICANNDDAALIRDKGVFASLTYNEKKLVKYIEKIASEKDIKVSFNDDIYFKKILKCFTSVYKNGTSLTNLLHEDNFAVIIHHLSREGRIVIAGAAATQTNTQSEPEADSFSITGFNISEYRKKNPDIYRQAGEDVLHFCEEGLITPTHSLVVGFYKINDALHLSSNPKTSAKVVIDIKNKEIDAIKTLK
ncbi:hypothetical protein KPH14_007945 [Odynerus spinipes]|uniref:Enoyl reductase (ER) domain-containing protein n=1 Tax=Odynerus spinipes TaxID=1348599 RepID=A0AAD9VPC1_9HYME|nr:hypothetical protein KPH14_007945 [Odynerus spinipes]